MDDFVGSAPLILRPGAANIPQAFIFSVCSSDTANDGSIPFGSTINSAAVKIEDIQGLDITTSVSPAAPNVSGLTVMAGFSYPVAAKKGRCSVFVLLTLSSGAVLSKRWDGLRVD